MGLPAAPPAEPFCGILDGLAAAGEFEEFSVHIPVDGQDAGI